MCSDGACGHGCKFAQLYPQVRLAIGEAEKAISQVLGLLGGALSHSRLDGPFRQIWS